MRTRSGWLVGPSHINYWEYQSVVQNCDFEKATFSTFLEAYITREKAFEQYKKDGDMIFSQLKFLDALIGSIVTNWCPFDHVMGCLNTPDSDRRPTALLLAAALAGNLHIRKLVAEDTTGLFWGSNLSILKFPWRLTAPSRVSEWSSLGENDIDIDLRPYTIANLVRTMPYLEVLALRTNVRELNESEFGPFSLHSARLNLKNFNLTSFLVEIKTSHTVYWDSSEPLLDDPQLDIARQMIASYVTHQADVLPVDIAESGTDNKIEGAIEFIGGHDYPDDYDYEEAAEEATWMNINCPDHLSIPFEDDEERDNLLIARLEAHHPVFDREFCQRFSPQIPSLHFLE
ncbi:hypothetical protein IFR05_013015 [Cadophora sp. M221]|nr:hypothetical protein IFR05_013015 [Cadophora sp. M221]